MWKIHLKTHKQFLGFTFIAFLAFIWLCLDPLSSHPCKTGMTTVRVILIASWFVMLPFYLWQISKRGPKRGEFAVRHSPGASVQQLIELGSYAVIAVLFLIFSSGDCPKKVQAATYKQTSYLALHFFDDHPSTIIIDRGKVQIQVVSSLPVGVPEYSPSLNLNLEPYFLLRGNRAGSGMTGLYFGEVDWADSLEMGVKEDIKGQIQNAQWKLKQPLNPTFASSQGLVIFILDSEVESLHLPDMKGASNFSFELGTSEVTRAITPDLEPPRGSVVKSVWDSQLTTTRSRVPIPHKVRIRR